MLVVRYNSWIINESMFPNDNEPLTVPILEVLRKLIIVEQYNWEEMASRNATQDCLIFFFYLFSYGKHAFSFSHHFETGRINFGRI